MADAVDDAVLPIEDSVPGDPVEVTETAASPAASGGSGLGGSSGTGKDSTLVAVKMAAALPAFWESLTPAKNVVFLSPQFPSWVTKFAVALGKHKNVNVLGIGDDSYEALPADLQGALTEYFRVDSMDDYDAVLRAIGFFTHKYGKIDRFESLNEHWLELEAQIRADFNIPGPKPEFIELVRHKSLMKSVFERAGVPYIKGTVTASLDQALGFAKDAGYPLVVKPDSGSGASFTYRVDDDEALTEVFARLPAAMLPVVVEQYMNANTLTYDGIVDGHGVIIFESSTRTEQSIMDVVNEGGNAHYVCLPDMPPEVRKVGAAIVKAYRLRERFFHIEIFERRDGNGLVGLEINLRPPGAWLTDAMNISHSTDVYARWAAMVAGDPQPESGPGRYYSAYASRKNFNKYAHTNAECEEYLGDRLVYYAPIEKILQAAMGDEAYLTRDDTYEQAMGDIEYIQERA
ncbi:MAG: hypothetical protein FWG25_02280 [Promicromonosporaceae bacterium]|nr:hypothetical protein [Promicromonosporaceae bacterium]